MLDEWNFYRNIPIQESLYFEVLDDFMKPENELLIQTGMKFSEIHETCSRFLEIALPAISRKNRTYERKVRLFHHLLCY
jgi:hypothetical protein